MNFAALPPEVNSALMYAGAGSGPIRSAAAAWQTMAGELESAAAGYRTVITGLTDQAWHGPTAAAMTAAITRYLAWMHTTATQAGQAATQASAAATAYEAAFAATVPPTVIATNRTQLATLVATNLLGQNTAAIAATEAHYAAMWAQDATAMYGYAAAGAAAGRLPTFTAPGQTANPAAATGGDPLAGLPEMMAGLTGGKISPGLAFDLAGAVLEIGSVGPFGAIGLGGGFGGLAITLGELAFPEGAAGFGALGALGLIGAATPATAPAAGLVGAGRAGTVWAGMGRAVPLGALSVPQAWAAAAPGALRQVALAAAQSGASAAVAEIPFAELGLAGLTGRAMTGGAQREQTEPTTQLLTRAAAPPAAEPEGALTPLTGVEIVAELRGLAELRDAGVLTDAEFNVQRDRLIDAVNAEAGTSR